MSRPMSTPRLLQLDLLDAELAGADYAGANLHLSTTNIDPGQTTDLAAFTEANYPGYAPKTLGYGTAFIDDDNNVYAISTMATFVCTSDATQETIYSWYLTDAAGTKLLRSGHIDGDQIPMIEAGDGVAMVLKFGFFHQFDVQISL